MVGWNGSESGVADGPEIGDAHGFKAVGFHLVKRTDPFGFAAQIALHVSEPFFPVSGVGFFLAVFGLGKTGEAQLLGLGLVFVELPQHAHPLVREDFLHGTGLLFAAFLEEIDDIIEALLTLRLQEGEELFDVGRNGLSEARGNFCRDSGGG